MTPLAGQRVAIANRAEVAVRIAATCRRLGAIPILLAGEPDLDGYAARTIGRVEPIGPAGSEFDVARVVAAARRAGADYLHPGYGFLSERADLSAACGAAGIRFVGPSPEALALCGDKIATRRAAQRAGVPVLPASPSLGGDPDEWASAAAAVGYPLLVKPAGAGGGRGLRHVAHPAALREAVAAARREGAESGAGEVVYLERELAAPRHVEVQVAADSATALALGDRDCSLQRRHQKVIEEAPAPHLAAEVRQRLHDYAVAVAQVVGLAGVATCEFLVGSDGTIAFLEVNPRLQVEHPVTELTTGLDLVEWQLLLAAGAGLPLAAAPAPRGHAIEARVYAEDPAAGFLPCPGELAVVAWPARPDTRVDAGYASRDRVPGDYDSLVAKVIGHGPDRDAALAALREALRASVVAGVATNIPWLLTALDQPEVAAGRITTDTAARVPLPDPPRRMALAAAVARTLERPPTADPWAAIGPFRVAGDAALVFHGDEWEERTVVGGRPGHWQVDIGGDVRHLRWRHDEAGIWTVAFGDEVVRVACAERDGAIEVAGSGGRWLLRSGPRPADVRGRHGTESDGLVRSPFPAKVLRVNAEVGARVAAGASLVTLSAMKIELVCEAPVAGTVRNVRCEPGAQVGAGEILVELTPDAPSKDSDEDTPA